MMTTEQRSRAIARDSGRTFLRGPESNSNSKTESETDEESSSSTVITCSSDSDCTPSPLLLGGLQFLSRSHPRQGEQHGHGDIQHHTGSYDDDSEDTVCSGSILEPANRFKNLFLGEADLELDNNQDSQTYRRCSPVFSLIYDLSPGKQYESKELCTFDDADTDQLIPQFHPSKEGTVLPLAHELIQDVGSPANTFPADLDIKSNEKNLACNHESRESMDQGNDARKNNDSPISDQQKIEIQHRMPPSSSNACHGSEDFSPNASIIETSSPPFSFSSELQEKASVGLTQCLSFADGAVPEGNITMEIDHSEKNDSHSGDQLVPSPGKKRKVGYTYDKGLHSIDSLDDTTQVDGSACMFSDSSFVKSSLEHLTYLDEESKNIQKRQNTENDFGEKHTQGERRSFRMGIIAQKTSSASAEKCLYPAFSPTHKQNVSSSSSNETETDRRNCLMTFNTSQHCAPMDTDVTPKTEDKINHCMKETEDRLRYDLEEGDYNLADTQTENENVQSDSQTENEIVESDDSEETGMSDECKSEQKEDRQSSVKPILTSQTVSQDVKNESDKDTQRILVKKWIKRRESLEAADDCFGSNSTRSRRQNAGIHQSDVLMHKQILQMEDRLQKVTLSQGKMEKVIMNPQNATQVPLDAARISKQVGSIQASLRQIATEIKEVKTDLLSTLRDVRFIYSQKKRKVYLEVELDKIQGIQHTLCRQLKVHKDLASRLQAIIRSHTAIARENRRKQEQSRVVKMKIHPGRNSTPPADTHKIPESRVNESTSNEDSNTNPQETLLQQLVGTLDQTAGSLLVKFMTVLQGKGRGIASTVPSNDFSSPERSPASATLTKNVSPNDEMQSCEKPLSQSRQLSTKGQHVLSVGNVSVAEDNREKADEYSFPTGGDSSSDDDGAETTSRPEQSVDETPESFPPDIAVSVCGTKSVKLLPPKEIIQERNEVQAVNIHVPSTRKPSLPPRTHPSVYYPHFACPPSSTPGVASPAAGMPQCSVTSVSPMKLSLSKDHVNQESAVLENSEYSDKSCQSSSGHIGTNLTKSPLSAERTVEAIQSMPGIRANSQEMRKGSSSLTCDETQSVTKDTVSNRSTKDLPRRDEHRNIAEQQLCPVPWIPDMKLFTKIHLINETELIPYTEVLPIEIWSSEDISKIDIPSSFFEEIDSW